FFFSSRRRHTRFSRDWSSDVCSSDLLSKDEIRYKSLQKSLGAYRMVFGQPRQDELLAYMLSKLDESKLAPLSQLLRIDLAPPVRSEERRVGKERRLRWTAGASGQQNY